MTLLQERKQYRFGFVKETNILCETLEVFIFFCFPPVDLFQTTVSILGQVSLDKLESPNANKKILKDQNM